MKRKLFVLNEDGVAEYVIAESKNQAFKYANNQWGGIGSGEYFEEYKKDYPEATIDEFIEQFVKEMAADEEFTLELEDGTKVTKTVSEHIEDIKGDIPCHLAFESY